MKIRADITFDGLPSTAPDWVKNQGGNAWQVELRYDGRKMRLPFYTGSALGEPSVRDVVECLVLDSSAADESFDEWAANYGYDTDSRAAYAMWQAVKEQTAEFRRLMGDDYDAILESFDEKPGRWTEAT